MSWHNYLGWALGAAFFLMSTGFILTALLERERRAALLASILALLACGGWFFALIKLEAYRSPLVLGGSA